MASRTRTSGARSPSSGLPAASGSNCTISGVFNNPKTLGNHSAGSYPLTNRYLAFSDNRASITDETGSFGAIHNCTNGKTVVPVVVNPSATFVQVNPSFPFGTATTTVNGSMASYYLDVEMGNPHSTLPDGASVALSRVPSVDKEMMSGLNSLYELKDCQTFLKLIPIHFLWAAARGKRAKSLRALHRWLEDIKSLVRSPLGILQAVAGADLMWKFGIKPLKDDVNHVLQTLAGIDAKVQSLLSKKWTVQGRFNAKASGRTVHVSGVSNDTLGMYNQVVATHKTTEKTWVYGQQKIIDPSKLPRIEVLKMRALAESLGLSLDTTDLWEAVPYSFVVDWFLPIQTFLEQFGRATPDPSWLLTSGAWSSVKTATQGYTRWDVSPISGPNCVVAGGTGLVHVHPFTRTDYQRVRLTTLPAGAPSTYIPRPQWPSFDQSITGIELLLQRIKRTLK